MTFLFSKVSSTNFRDAVCMTNMLENLLHTFNEFKMHEQIENHFIMKRLKEKMNALHIRDAKVCNCHSDNRLTEMLTLVLEGYRCAQCSEQDREKYGDTLRQALEEFTQVFIPHMEEEEEVKYTISIIESIWKSQNSRLNLSCNWVTSFRCCIFLLQTFL